MVRRDRITLPKKRPFWASCIVSGVLGGVAMAIGIQAYTMGALGIFSFTSNITLDGDVSGAIKMMILAAVAVISGFIVTYLLGFEDNAPQNLEKNNFKQDTFPQTVTSATILTPVEGTVVPLAQVKDAAFSAGIMGKGAAIEPTVGEVHAPFNGTVVTLFPTKHALGLISDEGVELLIHIGIDTVQLEGKYFEAFVKQGQRINKGDLLVKFDLEKINEAGYSTQIPIIVTNSQDYQEVIATHQISVGKKDPLLTTVAAQDTTLVVNPI